MKKTIKRGVIYALGLLISVAPPIIATLSYFPLWTQKDSGAVLSGAVLLLILISAIPLIKYLRSHLRSPSAVGIWLLVFLAFFALSKIADEMTVISFIGLLSNCVGALILWLGRIPKENK